MLPFLMIVGVAAAAGSIIYFTHRAQKERVEALRAAAQRLGWGFREEVPFETIPNLERFELFTQGRSKKLSSLMTSPAGDPRVVIFDYKYETGGGKSHQTHRQTVVYVTSDHLQLPRFSLRPQHFFHEIAKAFGYQDIDIERHPTFSEMFLLRGDDADAVRDAFTAPAIEFFEQRRGVCAAGSGRELLFWRAGRQSAADQLETLMTEAADLAARFTSPGPA